MDRPTIAYYVTAHGYGHGVRSCDVIRALRSLDPEIPVCVVSGLPREFFESRLGAGDFDYRPGVFDVGMVQLDSIRVDVEATLRRALELERRRPELVAGEVRFLRERNVALVVADIPEIPLSAAASAGIPRVAVGNFAWDWIYSSYLESDPRWRPVVGSLAEGYGKTDLLLRLPFSEPMSAFPRRIDLPLLSDPGTPRREEIVRRSGCSGRKKWVLLSFTTLDWDDRALDTVQSLDYEFFTLSPLRWERANIHGIDRRVIPFADVLASVDGVVSKPGYGILSECVANAKPLLYADRRDFAEYPILVRAVERYLQHLHVPAEVLYRGEIGGYLDELWSRPAPRERMEIEGAGIAARRVRELYPAATSGDRSLGRKGEIDPAGRDGR
jgi:hypothetical protein